MDPLAVIRTVWHHKIFVLPSLAVTLIAVIYVFQFGPRYFETSMSYALINPTLPTDRELLIHPEIENLNRDNPFLRASDASLITEVLIARLNSSATSDALGASGLSRDYEVGKGINGNGFVVSIAGNGESEEQASATTEALGIALQVELMKIQKVNGADDRFLFTALVVNAPNEPTEQFSSRLRSVIMVFLGGAVLTFGAVSIARAREASRLRKQEVKPLEADHDPDTQPVNHPTSAKAPLQTIVDPSRPQSPAPLNRRSARASRPGPRDDRQRVAGPLNR